MAPESQSSTIQNPFKIRSAEIHASKIERDRQADYSAIRDLQERCEVAPFVARVFLAVRITQKQKQYVKKYQLTPP